MNDKNMGNSVNNFADERQQREAEKYGRVPNPQLAAHAHRYERHSIEPAYGNYDRPISGLV